jgi:hypothetical protein
MVLAETFGQLGTAQAFFGGEWYLVGLFLLVIFLVFLSAYKVTAYGITTMLILGLLSISGYNLFIISAQITQTILFLLFMFVGFIAYLFFSK